MKKIILILLLFSSCINNDKKGFYTNKGIPSGNKKSEIIYNYPKVIDSVLINKLDSKFNQGNYKIKSITVTHPSSYNNDSWIVDTNEFIANCFINKENWIFLFNKDFLIIYEERIK